MPEDAAPSSGMDEATEATSATPKLERAPVRGSHSAPKGTGDWKEFISRYAAGDYHFYNFPTRSHLGSAQEATESSEQTLPVYSPPLGDVSSTGSARPKLDRANSASKVGVGTGTAARKAQPILPRASDTRDSSSKEPAQTPTPKSCQTAETKDKYQEQSAGPSNQDPDIPDIGASDLSYGGEEPHAPLSKQAEDMGPQQDLTIQHVKQLNEDQREVAAADRADRAERAEKAEEAERERRVKVKQERQRERELESTLSPTLASVEARAGADSDKNVETLLGSGSHGIDEDEHAGDPGPSSAAYRRFRRPPQDAELASRANRRMSVDSSPSDDEDHVQVQRSRAGQRSTKSFSTSDAVHHTRPDAQEPSLTGKPQRPRPPRSRGSVWSRFGGDHGPLESVLGSATGSSTLSHQDPALEYDYANEQERIREFFDKHGYLPAPRQTPDAVRRRLRVIRRLGLERPDKQHRIVLDRFTRLATSIFKTKRALVSVVGRDKQIFLSQIGFGKAKGTSFEDAFCCHTILGGSASCMIVPDAAKDWRFAKNPLVQEGNGLIQFYAGAPLRVGKGPNAAVIGSMCVIDDEPKHDFGEEGMRLLQDLAECAVSELELLYNQRSSIDFAKLHQNFLRRSLKHRPKERAGQNAARASTGSDGGHSSRTRSGRRRDGLVDLRDPSMDFASSNSTSSERKRTSGPDAAQDIKQLDIFDEACAEIRYALKADAVAIVDLSQFHLFYPTYQNSSMAGSTRTGSLTEATATKKASMPPGTGLGGGAGGGGLRTAAMTASASQQPQTVKVDTNSGGTGSSDTNTTIDTQPTAKIIANTAKTVGSTASTIQESNRTSREEPDGYQRSHDGRAARSTYMVRDSLVPSMTPQVLYIPTGMHKGGIGRMGGHASKAPDPGAAEQLNVLGYSSDMDAFAFDFTVTPASKKIIQEFIANHVKDRSVWYSRDDSEGIAKSITHLMPPGTETSLAMPVFGFDGQVAFAVAACWTDPLYTYPAGALQFVETIAGSLLASVMKEKLHQAERAQLNFAAAASHELRTPLHQINAAAALLRQTLQSALADSPGPSPPLVARTESTSSAVSDLQSSDISSSQGTGSAQDVPLRQPKPRSAQGTSSDPVTALRSATANRPGREQTKTPRRALAAEDRADAMSQLEMIEANGLALGQILENIIDTLDIGRVSSMIEEGAAATLSTGLPGAQATKVAGGVDVGMPGATGNPDMVGRMMVARSGNGRRGGGDGMGNSGNPSDGDERRVDLSRLLEEVVKQTIELENKSRRIAGKESLDKVEIILEVAPRTRGQWMMATDPGPLIRYEIGESNASKGHILMNRALSKVIHNACKFTDKGYIHISMQDTTQDVVLPSGYDNSVKLSKVTIDIKDTGCGMTPDFLDEKILQPFAKADPFMPGSGLGLSLALRMINLLGGTLGIDSTHHKGTIVRVNIPLHLYSADNESDQEEVANSQTRSNEQMRGGEVVRQDGVHLHGWNMGSSGTKRVGKAILRQLKWKFCRTVDDPRYANLIVVPGEISNEEIAKAVRKARPGAEVMVINPADWRKAHVHHQKRRTGARGASTDVSSVPHTESSASLHSYASTQSEDLSSLVPDMSEQQVLRVSRPLYPSIMRRITRPAHTAPATVEMYKSAVVGGQQATEERLAAAADDEALAAQQRLDNEQEDIRRGAKQAVVGGTESRQYRSNTATSTSVSISGDLSASEAAAMRNLSISEDLSEAEAAAMHQHGLSRYMSRPSLSLSNPVGHPSHANSVDVGLDRVAPSGSVDAHPDPGHPSRLERQASIDHADTSVDMVVGAEWSSSDGSQNDEGGSSGSEGQVTRSDRMDVDGVDSRGVQDQRGAPVLSPPLERTETDTQERSSTHHRLLPLIRPPIGEHASDPNPLSPATSADAAINSQAKEAPIAAIDRPLLKSTNSLPVVPDEGKTESKVLKVLVVEDNPVNRKIMVTMLKRAACHFAEAVDGDDAVHQFTIFSPDLVLLDINMPGKDGFQASTEMRKIEVERGAQKRARIVAVTALSAEGDKRRGMLECGIDEWKVKPVSMSQLREDVKALQV